MHWNEQVLRDFSKFVFDHSIKTFDVLQCGTDSLRPRIERLMLTCECSDYASEFSKLPLELSRRVFEQSVNPIEHSEFAIDLSEQGSSRGETPRGQPPGRRRY
jgi:hypothetical protein